MALYYNLPVYKVSYKLMKMLFACSSGFAREYKYTTGQELKNEGMGLIKNIYRANKALDKAVHIGEARENLEMIRLFMRLMQDFGQLSLKKKGYFMAMDRNILYKKIERGLKAARNAGFDVDLVLYLIRAVVFHDPTKNCRVKGKREDWVGLPKSKSLFFAGTGKGFPIGNLTSQLFGNVYLDGLDHFAREKLEVKRYGRYVDDMVFVHSGKEFLKSAIFEIRDYLRKELGLALHPKKIYLQHFEKGVSFLGAFIKPYRIYIGKKTKQNFYAKAKMWNEAAEKKWGLNGKEEAKKFVACVNSYLGIMKHFDTRKLREKMARSFGEEILKRIAFSGNFEKAMLFGQ